jgi:hypothetical protein
MKPFIALILPGILLLAACGPETGIETHSAWMRPAARGGNGAVYFVIHNHSSRADELIGVSSDAAAAAELHESSMSGDVMQMNRVETVPLEAYAEIEFMPGGLHVMLIGLRNDLAIGDEIEIILHFRNREDMTLKVPVRETAAPEESH